MTDRYSADVMCGGQCLANPTGSYWEVTDRDQCDYDNNAVVIDYVDEGTAKDLANRLSLAERGSVTQRQAARRRDYAKQVEAQKARARQEAS